MNKIMTLLVQEIIQRRRVPDFLFQILPYSTLTHDVKVVESSPVRYVMYVCVRLHESKLEDSHNFVVEICELVFLW